MLLEGEPEGVSVDEADSEADDVPTGEKDSETLGVRVIVEEGGADNE